MIKAAVQLRQTLSPQQLEQLRNAIGLARAETVATGEQLLSSQHNPANPTRERNVFQPLQRANARVAARMRLLLSAEQQTLLAQSSPQELVSGPTQAPRSENCRNGFGYSYYAYQYTYFAYFYAYYAYLYDGSDMSYYSLLYNYYGYSYASGAYSNSSNGAYTAAYTYAYYAFVYGGYGNQYANQFNEASSGPAAPYAYYAAAYSSYGNADAYNAYVFLYLCNTAG